MEFAGGDGLGFLVVGFWCFSGGDIGDESDDADEDEDVVDEVGDVDD